jgi:aspartate racemase
MRAIGMLGGMSWESSAQHYRLVNELARERLGGLHSARLVLVSVDLAEIEQLQVSGQWERAGELLAEATKSAEAAGAELLLLLLEHHAQGRRANPRCRIDPAPAPG